MYKRNESEMKNEIRFRHNMRKKYNICDIKFEIIYEYNICLFLVV